MYSIHVVDERYNCASVKREISMQIFMCYEVSPIMFTKFVLIWFIFFSENGSFVWEPVKSTNNGITVSQGCLIVPENGTYAVFSQITFRVFKENDIKTLVHTIKLENAMENEQAFQRRIISVPAEENRGSPEVIPSLFVTFVGMKAGGGICVNVSDSQYVYKSQLDNSINMFKLW